MDRSLCHALGHRSRLSLHADHRTGSESRTRLHHVARRSAPETHRVAPHRSGIRSASRPGIPDLARSALAMKQRLITLANAVAVFGAMLVLWQLVLCIFRVPPYMLPAPWAVVRAVAARFPTLLNASAITAEEALGGLLASIVVGVAVGLVFAQS